LPGGKSVNPTKIETKELRSSMKMMVDTKWIDFECTVSRISIMIMTEVQERIQGCNFGIQGKSDTDVKAKIDPIISIAANTKTPNE
jgi:hypothetical protein